MIETCRRRTNAVFRSDIEVAASTLQRGTRLCSRCLTVSCYLSCLRGQQAHRYLCISVRQMICRVLRVEHGEPASSWHLSFHHIGIESSKLRRPPCEHWEQIICCFISFCEQFKLWSQIVCVKYRLNHIHIIIIWRKKIFFDLTGGTFRLVPPLWLRAWQCMQLLLFCRTFNSMIP